MIVKIDKSFEKDVKNLKSKNVNKKLVKLIEELISAEKLSEIKNLKKLKSKGNYFRIRMGHFRIGLIFENKTIELIRILHRKDVYKYFP